MKTKALKIIGGVIVALIITIGVVYIFFAQKLVDLTNVQNANAANLDSKSISVDGYEAHYYTNNNTLSKDTLVLLHGLGDQKNSFVETAKFLTDDYFLILPDLLSAGENSKDGGLDLSINGQVQFVNNFLSKLGISKFHLAGNSMGGHTSAAYAIAYPERIKSLVLINAAGLNTEDQSVYTRFDKVLENEEDLHDMLSGVFYNVPEMSGSIKKLFIKKINESSDYINNKVIPQIKKGKYFDLKNEISQIKAPTLILWGKHDSMVKFNVAERFNKGIPLSEIQVIENASHSPQLELPELVGTSLNNFIQKHKTMKVSIPTTRQEHLAKVQLYRWYQLYERNMNDERINNQMEILDDSFYMKIGTAEVKGKHNYPERLSVYNGWKNAHHIEKVKVVSTEKGLQLESDIRYQNIRPNGKRNSYTIHYITEFSENGDDLPLFSYIELLPTGDTNDEFKDSYPVNRTKSLMYYWLASMESLDGNVTPFKEILADNFTLNLSTNSKIESISDLKVWLNETPMQLNESSHYPENFSIKTILDNEYEVTVEFDWKGIANDGKHMRARTKHIWYVIDNPNDRFAKILKADVSQIEPLRIFD